MIGDSCCAVGNHPLPRGCLYRCSAPRRTPRRVPFPVDALPDECLFEVLRCLPADRDRANAARVSKRWLSLLCSAVSSGVDGKTAVSRFLSPAEASDVRLAAATARANGLGGLATLWITGGGTARVTDAGLAFVARGSRQMTYLSIFSCPLVSNKGLFEFARCCPSLQTLHINGCPGINDEALAALAVGCPKLSCLVVEDCPGVGDEGLRAIGARCPLRSVTIAGCPSVGDRGVAGMISSAAASLERVDLRRLGISDTSLAVVGHYAASLIDLALSGLENVNERGFWAMGAAGGMRRLRSAVLTGCGGVTDLSLEALARGCPALRSLCLDRCRHVSDAGLLAVAAAASELHSLRVVGCDRITFLGLHGAVQTGGRRLELVGCGGIADRDVSHAPDIASPSIRSLSIKDCRLFGDLCLKSITVACPKLQILELTGDLAITSSGLLHLIEAGELSLVHINLHGCVDAVDDEVVSAIACKHGWTLRYLNLEGCKKVTDTSVLDICHNCEGLYELDISMSAVTDLGIGTLAAAGPESLRIISLSGCSGISEQSLQFLSSILGLKGIDLRHCKQIPKSAIESLRILMENCDIIC